MSSCPVDAATCQPPSHTSGSPFCDIAQPVLMESDEFERLSAGPETCQPSSQTTDFTELGNTAEPVPMESDELVHNSSVLTFEHL